MFPLVFPHIFQDANRKSYSYNFHSSTQVSIDEYSMIFSSFYPLKSHAKMLQHEQDWSETANGRKGGGSGRERASERASERERKGRKTNLKKKKWRKINFTFLRFPFFFLSSGSALSLSLLLLCVKIFHLHHLFFPALETFFFPLQYSPLSSNFKLNFFLSQHELGGKNGNRTTQEQFESIFTTTPALLSRLICMANT